MRARPVIRARRREGTRADEHLFLEVKGTTSNGRSIILTKNEVELHLNEHPGTALAIVSDITLTGEHHDIAAGGHLEIQEPFQVENSQLTAISYTYTIAAPE